MAEFIEKSKPTATGFNLYRTGYAEALSNRTLMEAQYGRDYLSLSSFIFTLSGWASGGLPASSTGSELAGSGSPFRAGRLPIVSTGFCPISPLDVPRCLGISLLWSVMGNTSEK
jgi:hypothetical protein